MVGEGGGVLGVLGGRGERCCGGRGLGSAGGELGSAGGRSGSRRREGARPPGALPHPPRQHRTSRRREMIDPARGGTRH